MKISLLFLLAITAGLIVLAIFRRHWLMGAWIGSLLLLPTAQARVLGAPIYLYDLIAVTLIAAFLVSGELNRWPRQIPRWHWWFIGSAFVLSVLLGAIRFGLLADSVWIWGHTSLAWMAFPFGIIAVSSHYSPYYRTSMLWGLFLSTLILSVIALVQYSDLPGNELISSFFYGGLGSTKSVEILRIGLFTNRATGPHFAPTGFAGVALLAAIGFWLLTDGKQRWAQLTVLACSATIVLCTVSRHALVIAGIGLIVAVCLGQARLRVKLISSSLVLLLLASTTAVGLVAKDSWGYRFAKWDEGVLNDDNIAARIFWGPARLMSCLSSEPSILLTGAGLEPEKLALRSDQDLKFESGFVSNGFLLSLYYLGLFGFILYGLFWIWALRVARQFPAHSRGLRCAFVIMAMLIVAADNYGFMYEPASAFLFLIIGLIAAERHRDWIRETTELSATPIEPNSPPIGGTLYAG